MTTLSSIEGPLAAIALLVQNTGSEIQQAREQAAEMVTGNAATVRQGQKVSWTVGRLGNSSRLAMSTLPDE